MPRRGWTVTPPTPFYRRRRLLLPPPRRCRLAAADTAAHGVEHPVSMNSRYNYAESLTDTNPQVRAWPACGSAAPPAAPILSWSFRLSPGWRQHATALRAVRLLLAGGGEAAPAGARVQAEVLRCVPAAPASACSWITCQALPAVLCLPGHVAQDRLPLRAHSACQPPSFCMRTRRLPIPTSLHAPRLPPLPSPLLPHRRQASPLSMSAPPSSPWAACCASGQVWHLQMATPCRACCVCAPKSVVRWLASRLPLPSHILMFTTFGSAGGMAGG